MRACVRMLCLRVHALAQHVSVHAFSSQRMIYEQFSMQHGRLTERAKARVVGDPFLDDTEQGPQVDEAQMKKILGYIDIGQQQGANLHTGEAWLSGLRL